VARYLPRGHFRISPPLLPLILSFLPRHPPPLSSRPSCHDPFSRDRHLASRSSRRRPTDVARGRRVPATAIPCRARAGDGDGGEAIAAPAKAAKLLGTDAAWPRRRPLPLPPSAALPPTAAPTPVRSTRPGRRPPAFPPSRRRPRGARQLPRPRCATWTLARRATKQQCTTMPQSVTEDPAAVCLFV